jgi:hypothetical protein
VKKKDDAWMTHWKRDSSELYDDHGHVDELRADELREGMSEDVLNLDREGTVGGRDIGKLLP